RNEVHGPVAVGPTCLSSEIDGCGGFTTSDALAVLPLIVCALMTYETGPLVLLYVPTVGAVTSTATVHVPPAAIVPPLKVSVPAPAAGAKTAAPQPLVEAFGVAATTMKPGAIGRLSVNATPEIGSFGFGLLIVNVRRLTPFARIGDGANSFAIDGGESAVSVALATLLVFVPVSVVERKPLTFECGP